MILQSMLLGLALLGQGSNDISEQQLNHYLQAQLPVSKTVTLPNIMTAQVQLNESELVLGQWQPETIRMTGRGGLTLTLPDLTQRQAQLSMTYDGKPRYDPIQHAFFLDNLTRIEVTVTPASLQQQYGFMLTLLLQGLERRLATEPVYRLDEQQPYQAWLKAQLHSVTVTPGYLHLVIKPV